jgi:DNA repair exonuclease SbcCD ATPase subunit
MIWKEADTAAIPSQALATLLTRSVYLQQDLVRQFIDSITEEERFTAVSELVGAGRVTDLQGDLEREKTAWTKTTNSRTADLLPLRGRLSTMESRLAEFTARPIPTENGIDEAAWSNWWAQLQAAGLKVSPVPMASREAAGAIDAAMRQLEAVRRAAERRQQLLDALSRDLLDIAAKPKVELSPLRHKVAGLNQQLQDTRAKVSAERDRVAQIRRLQVDLQEQSEQLRALAALALKLLGEKCPVCNQDYDPDGTRRRLESITTAGSPQFTPHPLPDTLQQLLETLASKEKELALAEVGLHTAEQLARDRDAAELSIEKRLAELGLKPSTTADRVSSVSDAALATLRQVEILAMAQSKGESFALRLSQVGDQATIQELQREIHALRGKLQDEDTELERRTVTGELGQRVIEALREAASSIVTERVREIEPLLSDIYSRIDVHPAFRVVRFLASVVRGRGHLSTVVSDPLAEIESDSPQTVLSSSQMNSLAVCAFLSLNLCISRPSLEVAILDDPLQSLDDINLLGLIDLLRRVKDQRQICVSTHDIRFGSLLARKLRPRSPQQRTVVIELEDWSRTGPIVTTRDVKCDPAPIRLVAS